MNFAMWKKALNVIPEVSKAEWDQLDVISKWLISTRAAVLVMTFISAALAGLFAWRDGLFVLVPWLALTLGLILDHASNNIFNDYTDFVRGVDKDNYFRTIYGAQPVASGLMTKRQHLTYFAVTGLLALAFGLYLVFINAGDPVIWILLGSGAFTYLYEGPGAYIKFTKLGNKIVYMEHVNISLSTLTYWGELKIITGK